MSADLAPTPHDALFKSVLSNPDHAAVLLRAVLPPALTQHVDWSSLTLAPGSFVDEKLAQRHTDLLFRVTIAGIEALVPVLFEHLSSDRPRVPLIILGYELRWYEAQEPGNERMPPLIPVVLTHGRTRIDTRFQDLLQLPDALREALTPLVPHFSVVHVDLSRMSDERIARASATELVRATLLMFRDGRAMPVAQALRLHIAVFRALEAGNQLAAIELLMRYALSIAAVSEHESILDVVEQIGPRTKDTTMVSIAEKLFQDGRERGLAEGLARGREEGREEGRARGRAEALRRTFLRMLQLKFGTPDASRVARVERASSDELERWIDRLLTADTVDDALAD